jgi:ABC-type multidrug transport system fused ATPase/permease subunit
MAKEPGETTDDDGGAPSGEIIDDSGGAQPAAGDGAGATTVRRSRRPRWLASVVAVLACLSIFVSTVAVWSHNTLLNTDAWVETVGPLVEDPAVTDAVTFVWTAAAAEKVAQQALPDKAQFLAAPIANALNSFVLAETKKLLQTQQFQDLWYKVNRVAHENAVKILRGEPVRGFQAENGTVTLNILPLLSTTMQAIDQKVPKLFGDQPIPTITMETPPDEARARLSAVLPVTLPDNFGVYTVFQSDQLAAAQQAVKIFDKLVVVLCILSVALVAAAIALATRRRRMVIGLAVGVVLAMALANGVIQAFQNVVLDLITSQTTRAAAETTLVQLVSRLRAITNTLLWLGVIVMIVAFITGDTRLAVAIRDRFGRLVGRATHTITDTDTGALPAVRDHAPIFRIAGAVLAVLALVVINVTVASLLVVLVLLLAYEGIIAVLAGGGPAPATAAVGAGDAGEPPTSTD